MTEPIRTPSIWIAFNACVALLLALDLGVLRRRAHAVSLREAALWSAVWVVISLLFNLWIWHRYGASPGLDFFTSYQRRLSLSTTCLSLSSSSVISRSKSATNTACCTGES